jgi:hypothetical protein
MEEVLCARPFCRKGVPQMPGHRKRLYCSDACKQEAYRERLREKKWEERKERIRQRVEAEQKVREEMHARWALFSWQTIYFLYELRDPLGEQKVAQLAEIIRQEMLAAYDAGIRHQS